MPKRIKAYIVRGAGAGRNLGKVYKLYPYTLRSLLHVMEDSQPRSYRKGPHVVTVLTGPTASGHPPLQQRQRCISCGTAGHEGRTAV